MIKIKRRIYFSCALTGLPESHRAAMVSIREVLKKDFVVLEFLKQSDPPNQIYHKDIHHSVKKAHFLVAVCDERSTGLGWEMGTAVEKYGKPVLALVGVDKSTSRLVEGVDHPRFEIVRYKHLAEIPRLVSSFERRHFSLKGKIKDFFLTVRWHIRKTPNA